MHASSTDPDLDEPDAGADGESSGDPQQRLEQIRSEQMRDGDSAGRQRRQNVRVDVQLPLTVRFHGRDLVARTRDISATGVGFSTRQAIEIDQHGEVCIEFDDWRFTKRVVVRFVKPILAGSVVGAQFEELTEDERERIVKQVFDVQRAQLQRGRQKS